MNLIDELERLAELRMRSPGTITIVDAFLATNFPDLLREAREMREENERLKRQKTTRLFPIQGGPSVPWEAMVPHDLQCQKNHGGQTIERIAQRGGLDPVEAWLVVNGINGHEARRVDYAETKRKWIEYAERINLHYARLAAAERVVEVLPKILAALEKDAPGTPLNNHKYNALGIEARAALAAHKEQETQPPTV